MLMPMNCCSSWFAPEYASRSALPVPLRPVMSCEPDLTFSEFVTGDGCGVRRAVVPIGPAPIAVGFVYASMLSWYTTVFTPAVNTGSDDGGAAVTLMLFEVACVSEPDVKRSVRV